MRWGSTVPDRAGFHEAAEGARAVPIVRRMLAEDLTPSAVYRAFGGEVGTFILESAEHGEWGRWSFVGVNCPAFLIAHDETAHWRGRIPAGLTPSGPAIELIREASSVLRHAPLPEDYPPFTGGLVGALGWEIVRSFEDLPPRTEPDVPVPDVALALATDVIAFDHCSGEIWLIACAINFDGSDERADAAYDDALSRLDTMAATLAAPRAGVPIPRVIAEDHAAPEPTFSMTEDEFVDIVERAHQAIIDGEVFQIVLSQRASLACPADPLEVYRVLRATNPSPYMYIFALPRADGGVFHIVGSSPETLVEVRGRGVRTFPIAGSRPRGESSAADRALAEELLADPKEVAEHVMLVDLARNDLNRVCEPGTVSVEDYMAIKRYSHIMHLTSTVTGKLAEDVSAIDALAAAFPAGTLSGAPKVRAMQLIDELEPTRRGLYGGVVGYIDLQGNLDMAIAIRTAVIVSGTAYVQAGAGIVADSVPQSEHAECRTKAAAALAAVSRAASLVATS
ncbi:anthranilate synthase component 1 [Bowdeniella nasicola]|uniref:Anthranilate synthase component 1 n=1 Tax=Bowdeniella nasicola TaxID=208480 RepID=A0A1H4AWU8_9ACTO|nr:chorismate-binding protein [Bowdeniella nasicola]SEA40361.1 anthranilate synthase component 1 [Bowdeniella nasicola]